MNRVNVWFNEGRFRSFYDCWAEWERNHNICLVLTNHVEVVVACGLGHNRVAPEARRVAEVRVVEVVAACRPGDERRRRQRTRRSASAEASHRCPRGRPGRSICATRAAAADTPAHSRPVAAAAAGPAAAARTAPRARAPPGAHSAAAERAPPPRTGAPAEVKPRSGPAAARAAAGWASPAAPRWTRPPPGSARKGTAGTPRPWRAVSRARRRPRALPTTQARWLTCRATTLALSLAGRAARVRGLRHGPDVRIHSTSAIALETIDSRVVQAGSVSARRGASPTAHHWPPSTQLRVSAQAVKLGRGESASSAKMADLDMSACGALARITLRCVCFHQTRLRHKWLALNSYGWVCITSNWTITEYNVRKRAAPIACILGGKLGLSLNVATAAAVRREAEVPRSAPARGPRRRQAGARCVSTPRRAAALRRCPTPRFTSNLQKHSMRNNLRIRTILILQNPDQIFKFVPDKVAQRILFD